MPKTTQKLTDSQAPVWIIGIGGSDNDDVKTYLVSGTVEQIKSHLIDVILSDRSDAESDSYEYGTENVKELASFNNDKKFYGYAVYSNSHVDYTATLATQPVNLNKTEKKG